MKRLATRARWICRVAVVSMYCFSFADSHAQAADTTIIRIGSPRYTGVSELVTDLTLGNGSDAVEYSFSFPFLFAARDGGLFIVDIEDPGLVGDFRSAVRKYDKNGKYVRSYGRIGDGPGEYRGGVGHVAELSDGRVLLSDALGVLVYSATGRYLERWRQPAWSRSMGNRLFVRPNDVVQYQPINILVGASATSTGRPKWTVQQFASNGKLLDPVTLGPDANFPAIPKLGALRSPFAHDYIAAWSPLGYWVGANSSAYAIDLHVASTDKHIVRLQRTVSAVPVQTAERAAWRTYVTAKNRGLKQTPNWSWSGPDIPAFKPPLEDLQVGSDGRLWVRVAQPSVRPSKPVPVPEWQPKTPATEWISPNVFDVIAPDGKYSGRVRFPDELYAPPMGRSDTAFLAYGDIIWAVVLTENDEPIVRRYRVVWK